MYPGLWLALGMSPGRVRPPRCPYLPKTSGFSSNGWKFTKISRCKDDDLKFSKKLDRKLRFPKFGNFRFPKFLNLSSSLHLDIFVNFQPFDENPDVLRRYGQREGRTRPGAIPSANQRPGHPRMCRDPSGVHLVHSDSGSGDIPAQFCAAAHVRAHPSLVLL